MQQKSLMHISQLSPARPVVLVCARVGGADADRVPGTTAILGCSRCGNIVLTAPRSRRLITARPDVILMCMECASGLAATARKN
jgi:hypothetical protein